MPANGILSIEAVESFTTQRKSFPRRKSLVYSRADSFARLSKYYILHTHFVNGGYYGKINEYGYHSIFSCLLCSILREQDLLVSHVFVKVVMRNEALAFCMVCL